MMEDSLVNSEKHREDFSILQVNRIRSPLKTIAGNSTAFGLKQPHLERTRLCELKESELEPAYITQRNDLQQVYHHYYSNFKISC